MFAMLPFRDRSLAGRRSLATCPAVVALAWLSTSSSWANTEQRQAFGLRLDRLAAGVQLRLQAVGVSESTRGLGLGLLNRAAARHRSREQTIADAKAQADRHRGRLELVAQLLQEDAPQSGQHPDVELIERMLDRHSGAADLRHIVERQDYNAGVIGGLGEEQLAQQHNSLALKGLRLATRLRDRLDGEIKRLLPQNPTIDLLADRRAETASNADGQSEFSPQRRLRLAGAAIREIIELETLLEGDPAKQAEALGTRASNYLRLLRHYLKEGLEPALDRAMVGIESASWHPEAMIGALETVFSGNAVAGKALATAQELERRYADPSVGESWISGSENDATGHAPVTLHIHDTELRISGDALGSLRHERIANGFTERQLALKDLAWRKLVEEPTERAVGAVGTLITDFANAPRALPDPDHPLPAYQHRPALLRVTQSRAQAVREVINMAFESITRYGVHSDFADREPAAIKFAEQRINGASTALDGLCWTCGLEARPDGTVKPFKAVRPEAASTGGGSGQ